MKTLVQFGAGNIGRAFIGQLFSRAGYEVIFIDIDASLVDALNSRGQYRVVHKSGVGKGKVIEVGPVRAILGTDREAVASAVAEADLLATAVGARALPMVLPVIAEGLKKRVSIKSGPIDIILAENLRNAAAMVQVELSKHLSPDFDFSSVGLVESSIGKMVPVMRPEDLIKDALQVFAEPYNTLILDKTAFRNERPDVAGISYQETMAAYVDRKLFLHNLGHAATAYFGFQLDPACQTIAEAIRIPQVRRSVEAVMNESAAALAHEYPGVWQDGELADHCDDLLMRFGNPVLGDTLLRVGKDLVRKLGATDRVVGALRLCARHHSPCTNIVRTYLAALDFSPEALDDADISLLHRVAWQGVESVLQDVSGLKHHDPVDQKVLGFIRTAIAPSLVS